MKYYSHRKNLLVYQGPKPGESYGCPVLTVEFADKWYGLQVVQLDGTVVEVPFPDRHECGPYTPPFFDHVPNPDAVVHYARNKGYVLGTGTLEAMRGRWEELEKAADDFWLDGRNRH